MTSDWMGNSEIVAGLLLTHRIGIASVRPEIFFGEYSELVNDYKEGIVDPETLIERHGAGVYNACLEAIKNINGAGEVNWAKILENSALAYDAGIKLEKFSKRLQRGDTVDWAYLSSLANKAQTGLAGDFVPLSEVQSSEIQFTETGWQIFDEHIGGIPEVGLIIVGGNPGVGKTTFMTKIATKFAQHHTDKQVAIFSIEMILTEIAARFRSANNKIPENVEKRILLNETPVIPEEAINKAASIKNLGLICIDFADLMIRGENSESAMAHIYRTLMIGAKQLHCPIILLSQLNRYQEGIPKPSNLRYTGLAEALGWMIIMLYDPCRDWHEKEDDEQLPSAEDRAYIIVWKVRGGFRKHIQDSPGAIQIPFRPDKGWGEKKGSWFSLKKY